MLGLHGAWLRAARQPHNHDMHSSRPRALARPRARPRTGALRAWTRRRRGKLRSVTTTSAKMATRWVVNIHWAVATPTPQAATSRAPATIPWGFRLHPPVQAMSGEQSMSLWRYYYLVLPPSCRTKRDAGVQQSTELDFCPALPKTPKLRAHAPTRQLSSLCNPRQPRTFTQGTV